MKIFKTLQLSILIFGMCFLCCTSSKEPDATPALQYRRIISFAPSITETLFALGLGDRVVGVTRFCTYPDQVKTIPRIGGYLDPNYEMILSLKPDLVLLLKEHSALIDFLNKNLIRHQVIDNENVNAILQSFRSIGALLGKGRESDSLVASIRLEMSDPGPAKSRPQVLICIGRDNPGAGSISKIFVAGPKTFYGELINYAGGKNAYGDSSFSYPSFSSEGIIRLAPDIIIDLMSSVAGLPQEKIKNDWQGLSMVPAVKNGLVFCPTDDYMTIPGPRMGLILRMIRKTVAEYEITHPSLRVSPLFQERGLRGELSQRVD
jgi:iron complex transport system substrate-binding protein